MVALRMEIGRCKFCGNSIGVEADSRDDADREATAVCDCLKAKRKRKFEKAYDALDVLFCDKTLEDAEKRTIAHLCVKLKEIE